MADFFILNQEEMRLRRLRQRVRSIVDLLGDKDESGFVNGRWAMVTLTYAAIDGWRPNHIADFHNVLRAWAARRGVQVPYVWVAELQQRGAVHYHWLCKLPKGLKLPKPDCVGWWKHGCTQVEWVRKSGKRYMAKYTSKRQQKNGCFPAWLRLFGCGGLPLPVKRWVSWLLSPTYVKQECEPIEHPVRCAGGYKIQSDGRFIPSPWKAMSIPGSKLVIVERKSMDGWLNSAIDYQPAVTWQMRRQAAFAVDVANDLQWALSQRYPVPNPWKLTL